MAATEIGYDSGTKLNWFKIRIHVGVYGYVKKGLDFMKH
jgi:hypothetical protein